MSWELTGNTGTNPDINFVGTTDNEPLVIRTNSTKQLLIDTAGRVGLCTTNPLQNLHVSGNILVNSVTNLNDDNIAIKSSGPGFGVSVIGTLSVTNSAIGGIRQSPTANGGLFFLRESSGQIDKISLDADGNSYLNAGNVGIGTTAPGRLLTLEGGAEVALRLRDKSVSNGAFWELQPTAFQSDYFGIVRYEGGVAQGSKSLIIAPDGNIGIGTYTPPIPYPKLTVTGPDATVNVETTEILRVMRHGVLGVKNQNSAGFFVGAFESGINGRSQLDIKVAGWPGDSNTWGSAPDVTVMSLYGDGNVSIGTTNLGARLEIEGGG